MPYGRQTARSLPVWPSRFGVAIVWDGITWREKKVFDTRGWLVRGLSMRAIRGGSAAFKYATLSGNCAPGGEHRIVQVGEFLEDSSKYATDLIRETVGR